MYFNAPIYLYKIDGDEGTRKLPFLITIQIANFEKLKFKAEKLALPYFSDFFL